MNKEEVREQIDRRIRLETKKEDKCFKCTNKEGEAYRNKKCVECITHEWKEYKGE